MIACSWRSRFGRHGQTIWEWWMMTWRCRKWTGVLITARQPPLCPSHASANLPWEFGGNTTWNMEATTISPKLSTKKTHHCAIPPIHPSQEATYMRSFAAMVTSVWLLTPMVQVGKHHLKWPGYGCQYAFMLAIVCWASSHRNRRFHCPIIFYHTHCPTPRFGWIICRKAEGWQPPTLSSICFNKLS